jgi:hypothetical protein
MDTETIAVEALKEIAKLEGDAGETAVKALVRIAGMRAEAQPLTVDAPDLIG